jgi:hypothetical protein
MATTPQTLNLVDVEAGVRLRTKAGQLFEVVENPQDGIWILCHPIDESTGAAGPMEPVFAQDIAGLA